MNGKTNGTLFAALAGMVLGAGATIIGAVTLSDKRNQKKISDLWAKLKSGAEDKTEVVAKKAEQSKTKIKKVANQAINKAEQITKAAKKEVRKI